jgi:hypothetical protein
MASQDLTPSYHGYVKDYRAALQIFEAFLQDERKPSLRARYNGRIPESGDVFIYADSSGTMTWKDGVSWTTPGKFSDNFLVFEELDEDGQPKEDGLVKRTIALTIHGLLLVCYFRPTDIAILPDVSNAFPNIVPMYLDLDDTEGEGGGVQNGS